MNECMHDDVGYFLVSNDHLMMIVCMQGGCSRTLSDSATMVLPIITKGMPIAKKMMATLERSERERERERESSKCKCCQSRENWQTYTVREGSRRTQTGVNIGRHAVRRCCLNAVSAEKRLRNDVNCELLRVGHCMEERWETMAARDWVARAPRW